MSDQTTPARILGCDVGKETIVVFDSADGGTRSLPNTAQALAAFAAELDETCLVICEATGGYEAALLDALARAGRPAHRADARKVKAFIRSLGILGKTDAIDARALARYGHERHDRLPLFQPREEARRSLHTLVSTRSDLLAQRVACANRLAAPGAAPVAPHLRRILQALDAEIDAIQASLDDLIQAHAPLEQAVTTLRAIPGVGATTAAALIAFMPELGSIDRRKAAALAGLAPHPRQSGRADAYRRTRGGRPQIKRILFMAALAARRHNPTLRAFYEKLRAAGKKPLVAITALMRKIIVIANARLRNSNSQLS